MKRKLFTLLLLAGTVILSAQEVKLMFGGLKNPLRKEQTKFLDFRYVSKHDPMFSARKKMLQGWNYNPAGGAAYGSFSAGTLPADILLEHGIACRSGKLTVPYAPKEAVVRIWVGDWFAGHRRLWGNDHKIFLDINGKRVYSYDMSVANTFKEWCMLEDYVFTRNHSIWDRIVKPILKEFTFKVKNPSGKITFAMNNILLTAMVIAPSEASLKKICAGVEAERRAQFAKRYPWKPMPDEPMPPLKGEKDMLLFQKSGLDNIHPWSRPKAHEVTRQIRAFAAQGEQEMMRFGILPLRDLKEFFVQVGDFKCGKNTISVKKHADLWRERYKERGSEGTKGTIDALWRLDPTSYVFQENKRFFAEKGTPRMFALDVHVPESAPAGDYYAPLTIYSGSKVICKAQLRLKVLPFKLAYGTAASYNFQLSHGLTWPTWWGGCNGEMIRKRTEERFKFMDKYGFHNAYFYPWGYRFPAYIKFGKITGKPGMRNFTMTKEEEANWDWWMSKIRRNRKDDFIMVKGKGLFLNMGWVYKDIFGMFKNKKVTPQVRKQWDSDLKDIERLVRQIDTFAKKKGYPPFYWYFQGELDNFGLPGTLEAVRLAKAIRRAGATTLVTINGKYAYKHTPANFDHVWANPASPVDENLKKEVEKHGHKFGTHNSGDTRFQAGFQFWRTGSEGRHQETQFYTSFMLPYVYLPWNYNTAQVYPSPDGGDRPSLHFLNYREGRDDYLYLHTLETLLAQGKGSKAARKNATEFIAMMKKKVHFDPRMYHAQKFDGIEATALMKESEWNSISIERYRWQIARLIMALEGK